DEIKDGGEIVAWVVAQGWSNGKVGALGNSYGGTSAQLLAVPNHPAVKAVIPRHYEFDVYTDIAFPGGVFNEWMVKNWNQANQELDLKPGVKPVDADKDKKLLGEALKMHEGNINVYEAGRTMTFRDDSTFNKTSIDDFSVHSFVKDIERSGVAISNWGSWLDAGTADAVIRSFMTFKNPQRTIVGAWNHGASQNASPYLSATSQGVRQRFEWLRFFDYYLKGIETNSKPDGNLIYYTMGEEKWKATKSWPPAGSVNVRAYFAADNLLTLDAPTESTGADKYTVDFEATTGMTNRWTTQLGGLVKYPDRAEEDKRLLTYTSAPLPGDLEITGYPVITLSVASTISDSAFFVYLEEVDESGKVTYLTEGQLRGVHHKISKEKPPYWMNVPYHSFRKKDAEPLVPGKMTEIKFGLLPVSVLVKKGHRVRIAIAGHDKSVFARTPAEGTPVFTIERNKLHASFIELPLIRSSAKSAATVNLITAPVGNPPSR
ncbi:MAG: CocE/NonD family hydrolase, partial [Pyrinomonadaceae bacterium]|nr:CocE/NonD family hydrolase [Pyrinomonadaceae bacterium]